MTESIPFLGRYDLPKCHLNLPGVFRPFHPPDPVRQTDAMGIRNDRGFSENVSHDQIRALPADTRERKELLESPGDFSSVLIPEHPHAGGNISGLALPESAGTDDLLNILGLAGCQGIDIRILFIELLHNDEKNPDVKVQ